MNGSSIAIVVVPTILIIAIFAIIWRRNRGNRPWPTTLLPMCAPGRAEEQMNVTTTTGRTTVFPKTPSRLSLDMTVVCLMCHSAPKDGEYDFCSIECKILAMACTPLLIPIPPGHVTFTIVESKFRSAWNDPQGTACPRVRRVFRIIESEASRRLYKAYRDQHGNEVFRYHGTRLRCSLGTTDSEKNQYPCMSTTCPTCNIIRTSFKVELSRAAHRLSFGQGIYTSSAANKASTFSGRSGVMFVAKVVLGKVWTVNRHEAVSTCPVGYDSVVFDKQNGQLNETVVYKDEAIRPIYLIVFG